MSDAQQASLRNRLGDLLVLVHGYSAPAVGDTYEHARAIFERIGDARGRFSADAALTIHHLTRALYASARPHAQSLCDAAGRDFPRLLPLANCYAAYVESGEGHLARARELLEEGARHEAELGVPEWFDVERLIDAQLSLVLAQMGDVRRARSLRDGSLQRACAGGTPADLAAAALWAAEAAVFLRDGSRGMAAADLAVSVGEENGLPTYLASAKVYRAWLDPRLAPADRVVEMQSAMAARERLGDRWQRSVHLTLLADAKRSAGEAAGALACLDDADAFAEETGERHYRAEISRIRGECALTPPAGRRGVGERRMDAHGRDQARRHFLRAVELARENGALLFELRAAVALDGLAVVGDRRRDARALLIDVYDKLPADALGAPDAVRARRQLERSAVARREFTE